METKSKKKQECFCYSGKPYAYCCQKYHQGALAENALVLMRSRYSAYALELGEYIIETTHSQSPLFLSDKKQWLYQIRIFSQQVSFDGLEILESRLLDPESFVTFVAYLNKEETDLTFTERSRFLKEGQAWKYMDGKITKGISTAIQMSKD